jgi:polyhydroxybutyrate depolymerase
VARIVVAALLLTTASCSDGDDGAGDTTTSSDTTTTTSTTREPPASAAGCGAERPATGPGQLVHATVESSGGTRAYMVYVPDAYDPEQPAPVAYVFHGATSNKEQQLAYSRYPRVADEDGALLVLPDALGTPTRWSPFGPAFAGVEGVDDLAFFDDLSAAVEASFCVDTERVLVSGMSSGGFMAAAVACTRSERVAAAGPVTATVWVEAACGEAVPVAYAYFHGTDDPVVPYEGGANSPGPVPETSQAWADQNGCDPEPVDERVSDEVVHRSWTGCEASTDLYTVEGGGHTWPGATIARGGYTTDDIDATEIIWETFRATWPAA